MTRNPLWFFISIILFGAFALFAQVLLLREFLVVFYGNEICLGLIFGCWLFWIAVGAWCARKISRLLDPTRSITIWVGSLAMLPLFLPVQIFSIRTLRVILKTPAGEWIPFGSLSLSVFTILIPVSVIIGFSFPAACRTFSETETSPEKGAGAISIGRVYIYEALGSLVGGILFSFFLVDLLNPFSISALGGSVLALSTLPLAGALSRRVRYAFIPMIFLILVSLVSLLFYGPALHDYSVQKRWDSFKHQEELRTSIDSRYQNIAVGFKQGQYSVYGNGLWSYSFPDETSFSALAHLALTQHPDPKQVLLLGGGEGGLIRELLKHPVQKITYVELDPVLIRTVEEFLSQEDREALKDSRVSLQTKDGRYFVKQTDQTFDAILLNLPDPDTVMLNRYYTLDFLEEIEKILSPGGMVYLGLTSTGNFAGEEVVGYGRSVYRTLKRVFPFVVAAPGPPQSFFASASPDVVTSDPERLARRYRGREIDSAFFSDVLFEQIFPRERVQNLLTVLNAPGKERLNTDRHPVTYFYNLILWGRTSGPVLAGFLGLLTEAPRLWLYGPLALLLIPIMARRKERVRASALFAIGSTGFYGLSVEIILLFLFQNLYGYVYHKVGLIVALFMLGLALGGIAANRILKRTQGSPFGYLRGSDGVILALTLTIPWLPAFSGTLPIPADLLIYGATTVIGGSAGFQFPIASAVCIQEGMGQATAAASIDNRDHLGACAGALLTGVLLVPLLGIPGTCYLIAGMKGVSFVGLLFSVPAKK